MRYTSLLQTCYSYAMKVRPVLFALLFAAFLIFTPPMLLADGVDTYCYDCLTSFEQLAYDAIKDCLTHLIPSWNCGSIPQETIQKAYDCFLMDHPEVFWTDGYTYVTSYVNNSISGRRVEFTYNMDKTAIAEANNDIYQSLLAIVLETGSISASYETVKAIYDYMVRNCTYDELNLDQSMYSVMVNKSGVCASFAKAFEFIMQCLEIPCTVVYGRLTQSSGMLSTTIGHEWNIVQLDGKWYHVDITSGLAISADQGYPDYRFLCTTTEEICRTHIIENPVPVPDCSSNDLEFFHLHGMTVDTYSRQNVAQAMLNGIENGTGPICRFSSYRAFTEAIDDLFTHSGIFQAIKDYTDFTVSTIDYSIDEQMLTIRLDV